MCIYPYHPARAKMADFDIVVFACTAIHQTVSIWPISEFPAQTCELLLLSLHSVCHVTIAHCNDSNGTDTRVRVRCKDSDVTDRKQSRVCNDSTLTDMS